MFPSTSFLFVFIATYSEDFFVECTACPAGYRCPNNKRPEPCPFAADVGFYYSTENSKFLNMVPCAQ